MSDQPTERRPDDAKPPPPTRAQRLAAFGFLGAFGLTVLTVLLTGLKVGAPAARHVLQPAPPAATTEIQQQSERQSEPATSARPPPAEPSPSVKDPHANADDAVDDAATRARDDRTRKDTRQDADGAGATEAR